MSSAHTNGTSQAEAKRGSSKTPLPPEDPALRTRKYKSFHAFRMTPEEKDELKAFASREELSVSDALRLCVLSHLGVTRIEYGEYAAELEKRGGTKWRVTKHNVTKALATGLSRKEAVTRAQRFHNDLAVREK